MILNTSYLTFLVLLSSSTSRYPHPAIRSTPCDVHEKAFIAAALTIALLIAYCIYTLWMYTNIARSIEAEQRLCSEAMTSDEVGLQQTFRAFRK